ncbi:MAG: hypothetical protein SFV23_03455 [Planctomycetaceae bacterium]|nr:hypothetical protein [Planctomycetaceae bacterium]
MNRWHRLFVLPLVILAALPLDEARADERLTTILASACRVYQNGHSGTAFFVTQTGKSPDQPTRTVVVTAAHVWESIPEAECRLVMRERRDSGEFQRREVPLVIRKDGQALWTRHPDHDVAAMVVTLPEGLDRETFQFDQLAADEGNGAGVVVGHEAWVPCFPATLEANAAGWPLLRRGTIASYPLRPIRFAPTLLMDITAFGGDSGAPVVLLTDSGPLVCGLVLGMQRQTDRATLPFEERTVHTPLGVSIVLQAPLIRETLERLP